MSGSLALSGSLDFPSVFPTSYTVSKTHMIKLHSSFKKEAVVIAGRSDGIPYSWWMLPEHVPKPIVAVSAVTPALLR